MLNETERNLLTTARLVLFGETHGFSVVEPEVLLSVVRLFKPTVVLYERLENHVLLTPESVHHMLEQDPEKPFSLVTKYADLRIVLTLAEQNALPLYGCDLPNLGRERPIPLSEIGLSAEDLAFEELLDCRREEEHSRQINLHMAKQERVLLICGAYHLRASSSTVKANPRSVLVLPNVAGEYEFTDSARPESVVFSVLEASSWLTSSFQEVDNNEKKIS